jgi:hypothetical protein
MLTYQQCQSLMQLQHHHHDHQYEEYISEVSRRDTTNMSWEIILFAVMVFL